MNTLRSCLSMSSSKRRDGVDAVSQPVSCEDNMDSNWYQNWVNGFRGSNKNARIVSRLTQNNKLRTETTRRDSDALNAAVSTDSSNATKLFLDLADGTKLTFDGHDARTIYRLLDRHYAFTGKAR